MDEAYTLAWLTALLARGLWRLIRGLSRIIGADLVPLVVAVIIWLVILSFVTDDPRLEDLADLSIVPLTLGTLLVAQGIKGLRASDVAGADQRVGKVSREASPSRPMATALTYVAVISLLLAIRNLPPCIDQLSACAPRPLLGPALYIFVAALLVRFVVAVVQRIAPPTEYPVESPPQEPLPETRARRGSIRRLSSRSRLASRGSGHTRSE